MCLYGVVAYIYRNGNDISFNRNWDSFEMLWFTWMCCELTSNKIIKLFFVVSIHGNDL